MKILFVEWTRVMPEVTREMATGMLTSSWMVMETRFDLDTRYTVVDSVGQGAYGVVCAARDRKRGARWQ